MLTKRYFNVKYYLKEQNLDYTGQQSDQLTHEAYVLQDNIAQKLMRFERKILRKLYGPTESESESELLCN
jgi:hypothetical protein